MDRRKFIGAIGGGLVGGSLVGRVQAEEPVRHLGDPDRGGVRERGVLHSPGSTGTTTLPGVVFRKGLAQRISLASQLPRGDRYNGGYFDQTPGYKSFYDNLFGVWFDSSTMELVYDGRDPDPFKGAANPNPQYFVGVESGPYNSHWQWPPTPMPIPQPVYDAGRKVYVSQGLANPNKHTAPVYCPYDRRVHIFGGDFSTFGLLEGGQNGRPVMWSWDPIGNAWKLDYQPPTGLPGDVIPLSPDIMGMCWLPDQRLFFIAWGVPRPGFADDAQWKALGGVADAYPQGLASEGHGNAETDPTKMPCFVFDPKLERPRFQLAGVGIDWVQNEVRQIEYDPVSKRVYAVRVSPVAGVRVHWLDASTIGTAAPSLAWQHVDLPAPPGHPQMYIAQFKIHVDETGRRLFCFDARHPGLIAITLPGHPSGEHRVEVVADLPAPAGDLTVAAMGLTASIAAAWIPEHRSMVLFWEPLWHQVGPNTASFTIDVDTGVVTQGPRFPNLDGGRNQPWFPDGMVWYPPTQELLVYGFMWSGDEVRHDIGLAGVPQTNWRYKWIDASESSHPVSAWTFFRIDSIAVD